MNFEELISKIREQEFEFKKKSEDYQRPKYLILDPLNYELLTTQPKLYALAKELRFDGLKICLYKTKEELIEVV